jgi:FixJ family two-component response regulator
MSSNKKNVAVVDDNASVRKSLARLLEAEGLHAKTYASAEEFLEAGRPESPACLILDVRMPDKSGLELQDMITGTEHSLPIIFITGHGDVPMTVRAMKQGALDFLPKPFDDVDLLGAVHRALEIDTETQEQLQVEAEAQGQLNKLTPRERQVFALVVRGLLNKQIARELGTSEKTIKVHRGQVMRKMEARSLPDLVRMAGLVGV